MPEKFLWRVEVIYGNEPSKMPFMKQLSFQVLENEEYVKLCILTMVCVLSNFKRTNINENNAYVKQVCMFTY